jgi:ATP-dependent Clp endopeptidase proteolytic subunit ClpP
MAKIVRDDVDRFFQYNVDLESKTLFLENYVDSEMAAAAIKGLHILDKVKPDLPITIYLENYGGEEFAGLGVYDFITQKIKSSVRIEVYGACMSMAAWILQAADERIMAPNSRFMIHVGYMGLDENHPEINKRWMKQYEKDEVVFEDILLDRIKEKHPKYTRQKVKKLLLFDTILNPEEALELGLIDGILGSDDE